MLCLSQTWERKDTCKCKAWSQEVQVQSGLLSKTGLREHENRLFCLLDVSIHHRAGRWALYSEWNELLMLASCSLTGEFLQTIHWWTINWTLACSEHPMLHKAYKFGQLNHFLLIFLFSSVKQLLTKGLVFLWTLSLEAFEHDITDHGKWLPLANGLTTCKDSGCRVFSWNYAVIRYSLLKILILLLFSRKRKHCQEFILEMSSYCSCQISIIAS